MTSEKKTKKEKKPISKTRKIIRYVIIGFLALGVILALFDDGTIDVNMTVEEVKGDNGYTFEIDTNLPEDMELVCSLYKGDELMGQSKCTVEGGIAKTETFSNKNGFDGKYTLQVTSGLAEFQSDSVKNALGKKGENLKGDFVKTDDNGEKTVDASFDFKLKIDPPDPQKAAYSAGQNYFIYIDWDKVFTYGAKVHYITSYRCVKSDNPERGYWLAVADADITNGFGAKFSSYVGIYMDEDLNISSCYYTDATGSDVEIPIS